MLNRKLIVVPASLAVLAFGAAGASADTFLLGSDNSSVNQGINNNQSASQGAVGGGSAPTIINKSDYSPSVSQGATNANVNAPAGTTGTTGDTFSLGNNSSSTNQGINNNQAASQGAVGGSGTTIVNGSTFDPSIEQGVTNANINAAPSTTTTGDLFLLGSDNNSVGQALNSSQSASQGGTGTSGTSIVNTTDFFPSVDQGTFNTNCNSDSTTCMSFIF